MAADIKKLISQLRKQVPEVRTNPLLDEIEAASLGEDEEADEALASVDDELGDEQPGPDEDGADAAMFSDDEAPADDADADADSEEDEDYGEPAAPKAKPKAKAGRPMPKMSKTNPFM
jgi:hypothetical protein